MAKLKAARTIKVYLDTQRDPLGLGFEILQKMRHAAKCPEARCLEAAGAPFMRGVVILLEAPQQDPDWTLGSDLREAISFAMLDVKASRVAVCVETPSEREWIEL